VDYRGSLSLQVPYTDDELLDLETIGKVIRFPPGSILVGEGEGTDFLLLIRKGHVKVVSGEWIIAVRGPGDLIGEGAAIRGVPRMASVFAIDEVEALYLPAQAWLRFQIEHPRAALAGRYSDVDRNAQATRRIREGELGAAQRVARALNDLYAHNLGTRDDDGVALPIGQRDLAAYTGLSLAAVVKAIKVFKAANLISTGRMMIQVRDAERLRKIANGDDIAAAT
jgi:CRP-like cAMP-binding protein